MNSEQLNAIKERAEKATPGPWLVEESRYEGSFNAVSVDSNYDFPACLMRANNAEFIAHAREDIPQLVAEVERLRRIISDIQLFSDIETAVSELAKEALGE